MVKVIRSLDEIAIDVAREAGNIQVGIHMTIEAMIACGEFLLEARQQFTNKSEWDRWTKQHAGMGHAAAGTVMRIAENKQKVLASGAKTRFQAMEAIMGRPDDKRLPPHVRQEMYRKRAEVKRLRRMEENKAAMKGRRDEVGSAYANIRKALEACQRASRKYNNRDIMLAMDALYQAEDYIGRSIREDKSR